MERKLVLFNIENLTFEAALPRDNVRPLLSLAEVSCNGHYSYARFRDFSKCSSIYISYASDIIMKGIEVQSKIRWNFNTTNSTTLTAGEISFKYASNVLIQDVAATRGLVVISSTQINITDCIFGERDSVQPICTRPHNFTASTARLGVFMRYTSHSVLKNVTVVNAIYHGVYLRETNNIQLSDTVSLDSVFGTGITLDSVRDTQVNNPVLVTCSTEYLPVLYISWSWNSVINGLAINEAEAHIFVAGSFNTMFVGLAMSQMSGESSAVYVFASTNVTFQNCSFTNFKTPLAYYTDIVSLPATVNVFFSLGVLFENTIFKENRITGINARGSDLFFSGSVEFVGNTASTGAAIILAKMSNITVEENGMVSFVGNHAYSTGGGIHIVSGEDTEEKSNRVIGNECFLHIHGERNRSYLTFNGNSAGKAGDVLYGGHLSIGLNGIKSNCLQNFWNAADILQDGLSTIASEASRVCLCNSSGIPDCLKIIDWRRHKIFPGQSISVSVVNVGQAFGTVSGSVFAQFIQSSPQQRVPQLVESQYTQAVGKNSCNVLNYTIFQSSDGPINATLTLTPELKEISYFISNESEEVTTVLKKYRIWQHPEKYGEVPFPKQILEYPLYINVTILPCPLGFELGDNPAKCVCSQHLRVLSEVECDISDETITRSGIVWIGVEKDSNEKLVTSEYCPLNYCKSQQVWIKNGDFDSQCNYDHSGILCGECRAGLSLALGSSQCLSCSNWYLVLILPFTLAGIGLVVFIKLINLTIAQGTINGLIFYVNVVKANEFIFLPHKATNPLTVFIAWANLDLGIETCFWDGLSAYSKTWLQFAFPLYIWAIAGSIVLVSKYSSRVAGWMGNNSVAVLATLFFLSYAKLLRTIIVGLSYTAIDSSEGSRTVWSADGNLEYLGPYHAPLFVVCIATLLLLWLPYTLLLFSGQWLYKSKFNLVVKSLGKIKPFLDAHYGPLKGKHRYWFGAQLLIRAAILLISACVPANSSSTVVFSISVSAVVLTGLSSFGFYQNRVLSIFELSFFVNLSLLGISAFFTTSMGGNPMNATYVLVTVVFAQFIGLVLYQLSSQFKAIAICIDWLCKKSGFGRLQEDDWEMFEYEREREREASEDLAQENKSSVINTITDSVPTY